MTDAPQSQGSSASSDFRRKVFYIPGYDPIHSRRYRELYRKQSQRQAGISGYRITQKLTPGTRGHGWHVQGAIDGRNVEADIEVLVWSDIVQNSMAQSILGTYRQLWHIVWVYVRYGVLFRLMRLRKGPVLVALYPIGFLLLQLVLALMSGGLLWSVMVLLNPFPSGVGHILGAIIAGVTVGGVLRWFKAKDNRFMAYYLMHDYAYSAQYLGETSPEMTRRVEHFAQMLRESLESNKYDEVLVVGHSSGAHIGVSVLADLLRMGVPKETRALSFLSLGHVVPMVSFLPKAQGLRRDLAQLSVSDSLTWVDVSAPGDACSFALCDPVAVSGIPLTEEPRWPLVFSAAFSQTLSLARQKKLKWRFFRKHFQYLCAFDRPKDYDYFQITAGPLTLAQRYGGRPASKSCIRTPLNKFTDL